MKFLSALLVFFFSNLALASSADMSNDEKTIRAILAAQETAWNQGDLETFMHGYWRSEQLTFVGQSGIKYGWQTTLDNYKKNYPDKQAMGDLEFTILKVNVSSKTAFVLGQWSLKRLEDNPKGYFSLYWKNFDGDWRIVIDHSS